MIIVEIPDYEHGFRVGSETEPEDFREYVSQRVRNPIVIPEEGITVWYFTSHEPVEDALKEKAEKLRMDRYIVPYQVPSVWSYMMELLPEMVRYSEYLVWSQQAERYKAYPNLIRASSSTANRFLRNELEHYISQREY